MRVVYLLNGTGLYGGVRIVFEQVRILQAAGVDAVALGPEPAPSWLPDAAALYRRVASYSRDAVGRADVAVASAWYTAHDAVALGTRCAHLCQGYEGQYEPFRARWPEIEAAYRLPTGKWVVSPHLAELIASRFGQPATWIPQPFDADAFAPPPAERLPTSGLRLLLTGQWSVPFKGVEWAVRALQPLREELPDLALVRLAQDIAPGERELWPEAEWHVHVPPADVAAIYRGVDIFLGPSSEVEGFGLPTLEAMSCGRATILTDIGAFRAIDPDAAAGLRIAFGDAEALRAAVRQLAADPVLRRRLGEAGRQIALRFSAERTRSALLAALGAR